MRKILDEEEREPMDNRLRNDEGRLLSGQMLANCLYSAGKGISLGSAVNAFMSCQSCGLLFVPQKDYPDAVILNASHAAIITSQAHTLPTRTGDLAIAGGGSDRVPHHLCKQRQRSCQTRGLFHKILQALLFFFLAIIGGAIALPPCPPLMPTD